MTHRRVSVVLLAAVAALLWGTAPHAQGDGMTPLHHAADRGDAQATASLLASGASPSAVTRIGEYTPLHIAAKGGHESGGNFRNDPQRAALAGQKGGQVSGGNFKFNRERAAEAGRKGGLR